MVRSSGLPQGRRPDHYGTKLSELLNRARDTGIRQYQIAGICKVHPTTLGLYAAGKKPIPVTVLVALSKFFNVPPGDIIGNVKWEGDSDRDVDDVDYIPEGLIEDEN